MKHQIDRERLAMLELLALAASDACDVQGAIAIAIGHELGVVDADTHAREQIARFVNGGPLQDIEELLDALHVTVGEERRAESGELRAESGERRAESGERRAES